MVARRRKERGEPTWLERGLRQWPDDLHLKYSMSCKRIDEALDALKKLLAKEPDDGKVLQQYLALLQKQGRSRKHGTYLKISKI